MDLTKVSAPGWMDKAFSEQASIGLVWLPEYGMGYYPVKPEDMPYDAEYFAKYRENADTGIGRALTQARMDLVARHYTGFLLDVGIGCGQFVEARPQTFGYDVNPAGVAWLRDRGWYQDLYAGTCAALSFWDSLEHIQDPGAAVRQAREWVFVSLPIFDGADHCLRSKHFRKNEHIWYWTHDGIIRWMAAQGFECVESNTVETEIGREGIGSYAFRRR
ncbi:methyltransferase domain-containing protein [Bordetella genomosp. 7]|uniref:methyltransferase domain-containing protein n=1 Tax=Bordetella genomosp. 7 TaxID=1416805 RepID=UPI0020166F23|nr:methyltransferase domain-containing protein [Bordetella genomosp. 7]